MIPLYATDLATRAFPAKHPQVHESHYRSLGDLTVSSISLGTRLGEHDDRTDKKIEDAVKLFFSLGGNFIDASISDRFQRSEKAVGRAIAEELSTGKISRREIVVATKGGFIPSEEGVNLPRKEQIKRNYIDTGLALEDEIVMSMHCMSKAFLRNQIMKSRENLQLETIDLYYLHNPECEAPYVERDLLLKRIRGAMESLEEAANDGYIRRYGVSTWSAFRVGKGEADHIDLPWLVNIAESIAGARHHFRALQVPYNVLMTGAAFNPTQEVYGHTVSIVEAAEQLGIDIVVSTPLSGGSIAKGLPQNFRHAFPRFEKDSSRALDFVISTPGIKSAAVGMKEPGHVSENCSLFQFPALTSLQWAAEVDQLNDIK